MYRFVNRKKLARVVKACMLRSMPLSETCEVIRKIFRHYEGHGIEIKAVLSWLPLFEPSLKGYIYRV